MEPGGAERMAVNYANGLSNRIAFSGLIATRKEGVLKEQLDKGVYYDFLKKESNYDIKAFLKLRSFCLKNKVQYIHAHSSSFFWAILVKLTLPKVKVIWHDHYGNSEFLERRPKLMLKITSYFFYFIISVNNKLKDWSLTELNCKNVIYFPNFPEIKDCNKEFTTLFGKSEKRIVNLANLRPQKNHELILNLALKMMENYPDWSFHLIGKDFQDKYSSDIKKFIKENKLEKNVFLYGAKNDVKNILQQAQIAIITSHSEGLPVSLLEFGLLKLPVVTTKVGEIPNVVENNENGILSDSNIESFFINIKFLIENNSERERFGENLFKTISSKYSSETVINIYLKKLENK